MGAYGKFDGTPVTQGELEALISAGSAVPPWEERADWQFVVLESDEHRRDAFDMARRLARRNRAMAPDVASGAWAADAEAQYEALEEAPLVIVPVLREERLRLTEVENESGRTQATSWWVVERMVAHADESRLGYAIRIPTEQERNIVLGALDVPAGWTSPAFLAVGHMTAEGLAEEDETAGGDVTQVRVGRWGNAQGVQGS